MVDQQAFTPTLEFFRAEGLISADEVGLVTELFEPGFAFADALGIAETVHVQVKVADVAELPHERITALGVSGERQSPGFHKYSFPGGLCMVFTHGPIAEEDLIPGAVTRDLPFVDHLGIDLREDSQDVRRVYEELPESGAAAGWRTVQQGGPQAPVVGCSCSVAEKRWVFPPEGPDGRRRPIEFAYGELELLTEDTTSCDYRPIDPDHPLARLVPKISQRAPQFVPLQTRPS